MKYKVGDKTLLGEIVHVDKMRIGDLPYYVVGRSDGHWLTESEIDAIICKPKRNIDQTAELLEKDKAPTTYELCRTSTPSKGQDDIRVANAPLEPYIESRKYPVLTAEELKAVKWLVEGGYEALSKSGCDYELHKINGIVMAYAIEASMPFVRAFSKSEWLTETPIDLKELLEAQEDV